MVLARRSAVHIYACSQHTRSAKGYAKFLGYAFILILTMFLLAHRAAADCNDRLPPITIEAEDFCEQSGVLLENTSDSGGGQNVGWIDSGDWLAYRINIPEGGAYRIAYRIASAPGGGQFVLEGQGGSPQYAQIDVPGTGGWQSWQTISHSVNLPAGAQSLAIAASVGGFNINWIRLTPESAPPVTLQAEAFSAMSGIRTQPTQDAGGGENVGWIDAGDWLAYSAQSIGCAGEYRIEYRVASARNGGSLRFERSGGSEHFGTISFAGTGGWQSWQTVSHEVNLPGGSIPFGIVATQGGWNLNWFRVTQLNCNGGGNPNPPPPQTGITAARAASEMGKGFNLGQMFENDQHPRTFSAAKAKIDAYYALGHRNVRIPITWTSAIGGSTLVNNANVGDVNRGHPRLEVIERVVDYALELDDMYVVINTHHERALKDQDRWWVLEQLWEDITDIFKNRSERLLFEILNEPHKSTAGNPGMDPAVLRDMTGRAYDKIRQTSPERIIIIGGNQWFGAHEMAITWPHLDDVGGGNDPYLMATFHHYDPWSFNGSNQGDYSDNWNDANIYNPMDLMADWANSVGNGMPVYIGEWGVGWGSRYDELQCNNVRLWYSRFESLYAADREQPTAVWDDGGWFKIFDHATNDFDNNLFQCIDGTCEFSGNGARFFGCQ